MWVLATTQSLPWHLKIAFCKEPEGTIVEAIHPAWERSVLAICVAPHALLVECGIPRLTYHLFANLPQCLQCSLRSSTTLLLQITSAVECITYAEVDNERGMAQHQSDESGTCLTQSLVSCW